MRPLVIAFAMLCAAAPARAQAVIDPGMSRDQVVERLGKPVGERSVGAHTYLFYRNGCERKCGMHDIVTLQDGSVVDAVFRSASRRYTGESSSPASRKPVNQGAASMGGGAAAGGESRGGGVIIGGPRPCGAAPPEALSRAAATPRPAPARPTTPLARLARQWYAAARPPPAIA